jgi:hypothetical protein
VHASFETLLDRQRDRASGRLIGFGAASTIENPLLRNADPHRTPTVEYSPWTQTVFEIGGAGLPPGPPEYYFADGVYPVYDPGDWQDPSLTLRAVPRDAWESLRVAEWRRTAWADKQRNALGVTREGEAGQGIQVVVPITMPGALSEVFGRGATSIKVTGRENLSFAGESRRQSNFIANESGRGQSLFPRLDMKQELQVKLEGTIGDKVHVQVDHNSQGFGADANRINIYYQGYDDDIVRRVDLGGTNLALPGSNLVSFSGGHKGLFGIKTEMWLGSVKITSIASKEEAEVQTQSITPQGGTPRATIVNENGYARDRFFFYQRPSFDYTSFGSYLTYGIDITTLVDKAEENTIRIFVDTQDTATEPQRDWRGFAVADLPVGADSAAARQLYTTAAPETRYPANRPAADGTPNNFATSGRWKEIPKADIGFVYFTAGDLVKVIGFFFRNGSVGRSDAVGIAIEGATQLGTTSTNGRQVWLKLVRHPEQETDFNRFPTAAYMMRHVYALGSSDVSNLEVKIVSERSGKDNPDVPDHLPNSTYLHMFGLDDLDTAGQRHPDGIIDLQNPNLVSRENGFLYMPGVRPFSPPDSVLVRRLQATGLSRQVAVDSLDALFPSAERVDSSLYTLGPNDSHLPQRKYHIEATSTGTENEIILPQDIIEGSEVVKLDERVLTRGVDYDIENFAGGRITLKGDVLNDLQPTSRLTVTFQYRPLFGGGKSSLIGIAAESELGLRGRLGAVWLYESTGNATRRPKLGEEPTRTMVGDLNATFRFDPNWMTRLVNKLPFTNASAASQFNFSAEAAVSMPNPNTKKTAYVDDLEGADESDDQSMSRTNWSWASIPIDNVARRDTLLRVPLAFYNPSGEVKRGYLNPTLDERERNDGLTVLELGFDRDKAAQLDTLANRDYRWSGVMRSFGTAGIDLSRTKSIEFWLNDFIRDRRNRNGKMHIDFGDISEDFIFYKNRPGQFIEGSDRFNREANSASEFSSDLELHDLASTASTLSVPPICRAPAPSPERDPVRIRVLPAGSGELSRPALSRRRFGRQQAVRHRRPERERRLRRFQQLLQHHARSRRLDVRGHRRRFDLPSRRRRPRAQGKVLRLAQVPHRSRPRPTGDPLAAGSHAGDEPDHVSAHLVRRHAGRDLDLPARPAAVRPAAHPQPMDRRWRLRGRLDRGGTGPGRNLQPRRHQQQGRRGDLQLAARCHRHRRGGRADPRSSRCGSISRACSLATRFSPTAN